MIRVEDVFVTDVPLEVWNEMVDRNATLIEARKNIQNSLTRLVQGQQILDMNLKQTRSENARLKHENMKLIAELNALKGRVNR